MNLSDLTRDEQLVLGALIRLIVRADGRFTVEEEERIQAVGAEIGGADLLWRVISDSAQRYTREASIDQALPNVTRPEARGFVYDVVFSIAMANALAPGEAVVLDALRAAWDIADDDTGRR